MSEERVGRIIAASVFGVLISVGTAVKWFAATQEAAAFNRCNPGAHVTTWEAVWAEYRITDCKVKG